MAIPASNGKTVLITGINGYIASVLGLHLLEKGYSLRGTSRRTTSVEPLLKGPYAAYQDRVKIHEVSDMTVAGAFDEAARGTTFRPSVPLFLKARANLSQVSTESSLRANDCPRRERS
jgi:NAD(P)-dependent dehydrogenase (short-subunit alcohol dehydrogenase family)